MLRSRLWLAWRLKLAGYGYWVFAAPRWWERYDGFPDVRPRGEYGNVGFIYMGHDGPITSRRLEAYRDGWEDYKLLWLVKQCAKADGRDPEIAQEALAHIESAVEEVLSGASPDRLRQWRQILLEDAVQLGGADSFNALITGVETTRHSATIKLSSSDPVRVWTWLDRGANSRRFIDASRQTHTPVVTIDNLVPSESCKVNLVVGGPLGQQVVLQHAFTTRSW